MNKMSLGSIKLWGSFFTQNRNLSISRCFYLYLFRAYFTIRECFEYIFCIAGTKGDEVVFNVKQSSAGIEIVSSKVEFDSIHLCPFIQI